MNNNVITFDPIEILSGTSNRTHPLYVEAAKDVHNIQMDVLTYK